MNPNLDDIGGARELAWYRIGVAKEVIEMVEEYLQPPKERD